jgi:malonyl-CoA O-methyltransferase
MDPQPSAGLTISTGSVSRHFNKHAQSYDDNAQLQHSMVEMVLDALRSHAEAASDLLEFGCGTGDLTALMLQRSPKPRITAVDIAENMVDMARRRVEADPSVEFLVADIEGLEWEARFDVVTSSATIQWLRFPGRTMARLKQSLRRNGLMVHTTFGPLTFERFFSVLREVEFERGLPPAAHRLPLMSLEQWGTLFERTGMERVDMHSVVIDVPFKSSREWLGSLRGTGAAINSGPVTAPSSLRQAIDRHDEKYGADDGVSVEYEILTLVTRNPT